MRRLAVAAIGALAALPMMASCGASKRTYTAVAERSGDAATFVTQHDTLVLEVRSASGIGSASFQGTCGAEVRRLRLKLHLHGLESLRFAWADSAVHVAIPSSEPARVNEELRVPGGGKPFALAAGSVHWMPVRLRAASGGPAGIPLLDGWIEVDAPQSYLASWRGPFTIAWVDFYR